MLYFFQSTEYWLYHMNMSGSCLSELQRVHRAPCCLNVSLFCSSRTCFLVFLLLLNHTFSSLLLSSPSLAQLFLWWVQIMGINQLQLSWPTISWLQTGLIGTQHSYYIIELRDSNLSLYFISQAVFNDAGLLNHVGWDKSVCALNVGQQFSCHIHFYFNRDSSTLYGN